jgi:putative SOS response-associated peptidase YedK
MCGRYTIAAEPEVLEERFGATFAEPMERRYNAAPSQGLPVILNAEPERIRLVSWGINPWWLKRSPRRDGVINVRVETLRDKFRDDLAERRCLVLADGFMNGQRPRTVRCRIGSCVGIAPRSRLPVSGRSARTQWGRSPLLLF